MGYSVTHDALKFYLKTARETTIHRAITRIEQSIGLLSNIPRKCYKATQMYFTKNSTLFNLPV